MMNEDQPIMKNPNPPRPNNILRLVLILFGIVLIVLLASFAVIYSKNYAKLQESSQSKQPEIASRQFLRLEFTEEQGEVLLKRAVQIEFHPTAIPLKPEDGYQINVEKDGQNTYETYIYKTQDPLSTVIPQSAGSKIIVSSTKTNAILLTLNYDEIVQTATKEIPQPTPIIQRNIAKEAFKEVFRDLKENLPIPLLPKAPTAEELAEQKQQVISKLPYNNDEFSVEYSAQLDSFSISLSQPYKETAQKVQEWFKANGLEDICQVEVVWFARNFREKGITANDVPQCAVD